ncbi:MAG: hypothetical protein KA784_00225 [Aquabacterium sp.]|nr:hypothetical protein [Aquabacterium sp.]
MKPSYKPIPSTADIRASLAVFSRKQLDDLGELTGVPATTIYKIKRGVTLDPGIETVRKLLPHLRPVKPKAARSPSSVRRSA